MCMGASVSAWLPACMHVYLSACMRASMHVCGCIMHACMCLPKKHLSHYTHVYTHKHIQPQTCTKKIFLRRKHQLEVNYDHEKYNKRQKNSREMRGESPSRNCLWFIRHENLNLQVPSGLWRWLGRWLEWTKSSIGVMKKTEEEAWRRTTARAALRGS